MKDNVTVTGSWTPLSTYRAIVKRSLHDGDCTLCPACSEPVWVLEPDRHVCYGVSARYAQVLDLKDLT